MNMSESECEREEIIMLWIGKKCMSQSEMMEVGTLKLGFTEVADTFLKLRSC